MPNENAANNYPSEIKPMTDSEVVAFCDAEISKGIGGGAADSSSDVSLPLDYYLGRVPRLSKSRARDRNASRYVSQDVMDGIEATVAEIMPAFTTDEIGFYEPIDQGDEDQARMESDIVNYLFMEEFDGFTILQTAIKDALLHKNCYGKVMWDERHEVEYEDFENVPQLALPQLLTPAKPGQQVEVVAQEIVEEGNPQAAQALAGMQATGAEMTEEDMVIGQQLALNAQPKFNITVKRTTPTGRPIIMNTPPEQTVVSSGWNSPYLHECPFVAHDVIETQSSLIQQGYDPSVVAQLTSYDDDLDDDARNRETEEGDLSSSHRSVRKIRVQECYCLLDVDGDGIAERRRIVVSDGQLLSNEPFNGVAIIGGVAIIMPHKHKGISMFERLKDIQDSKTPVMRSIIDGTQLASNPRVGVLKGKVNLDDLLTSRTGGIVRMARQDAVFEFPTPQIPASSYQFLEQMDMVRRDRGGGAVDSAAQATKIQGDTAHGLERVMSQMELGNALIARNIGETFIRGIFLEMHNVLRKNYPEGQKLNARVGGKWVETVPSEWKKRTKVTIQVGASLAERARQSQLLRELLGIQGEFMQLGSTMYSEDKQYTTIADMIKLNGLRTPERYFVDPTTKEGKVKSQLKTKAAEEMKAKEDALQQIMVRAQAMLAEAEQKKADAANNANVVRAQNEALKAEIQTLKTQLDAMAKNQDLQFKYAEMMEETARFLTKLETEYNMQKDADLQANRASAGGEGGEE